MDQNGLDAKKAETTDKDSPIKQTNKRPRGRSSSVSAEPLNSDILKAMAKFNKDVLEMITAKNNDIMVAMSDMRREIMEHVGSVKSALEEKIADMKIEVMSEVKEVQKATDDKVECLEQVSQVFESRMGKLERQNLEREVVITGVPYEQNENVAKIINHICQAVNFNMDNSLENIFRIPSRATSNTPIIIKFWSKDLKYMFMSGYFKLKNLNLTHAGFNTAPRRIFINESLTPGNREIFALAQRLKKEKKIHQVRTRGGLVYVSVNDQSGPLCIINKSRLESLVA